VKLSLAPHVCVACIGTQASRQAGKEVSAYRWYGWRLGVHMSLPLKVSTIIHRRSSPLRGTEAAETGPGHLCTHLVGILSISSRLIRMP
jgi:hypothetical protein